MDLVETLREEAYRRLEESRLRIHACVDRLNDEQLWHRPNAHVVSVGNLVLHLTGNVGQWINSTLGSQPDRRVRDREFDEEGPVEREVLLGNLDATMLKARSTIRSLREKDFTNCWPVQGFRESGTAIVLHVVEHFSYHTGQITLHTKLLLDIDTGYYAGQDLNAKG
jgi:uncharacterized damage-inducible protein DinB